MKKLFLLKNLGQPTHGETRAMLVSAVDELDARNWAGSTPHVPSHNTGDPEGINGYGDEGANVWRDSTKSSCTEIAISFSTNLGFGVVLTDYIYA